MAAAEHYGLLQGSWVARLGAGDVIRGGGGIRKLCWTMPCRGKSGFEKKKVLFDEVLESVKQAGESCVASQRRRMNFL